MTTFEDLDLGEAFGDFGDAGTAPRRRSRAWGAIAIVVALALVVLGVAGVDAIRSAPSGATDPTSIVPALAADQSAADRIATDVLETLTVTSTSTRLLGTSAWGTLYAGTTTNGSICLVTLLEGDLPTQSCAPANDRFAVTATDPDGRDVVTLAAAGHAPNAADGWQELAPNVWTRD